MRDKGRLHIEAYFQAGIQSGEALEIGPGPGYVGLEWLKNAPGARLTGLEISQDMITLAKKNASAYGLEKRVNYVRGDAQSLPFPDNYFSGVFSNGSLHEWQYPEKSFREIYRVLKPGGVVCVTDLQRGIHPLVRFLVACTIQPKEIRPGFISSVKAAYLPAEIAALLQSTPFTEMAVTKNFMGLTIVGKKS